MLRLHRGDPGPASFESPMVAPTAWHVMFFANKTIAGKMCITASRGDLFDGNIDDGELLVARHVRRRGEARVVLFGEAYALKRSKSSWLEVQLTYSVVFMPPAPVFP